MNLPKASLPPGKSRLYNVLLSGSHGISSYILVNSESLNRHLENQSYIEGNALKKLKLVGRLSDILTHKKIS